MSFIETNEPSASDWDAQAEEYASAFSSYNDRVEADAMMARLSTAPGLAVLDHGAGTGRMTEALFRRTGQPVVALDYSVGNLRLLLRRCADVPVLAVHADVRRLPLRAQSIGAVCSAGVYPLLPAPQRAEVLEEMTRVLHPDGGWVLSTLNFNLLFRWWAAQGNPGAREGQHLHGGDIYYRRQTPPEFVEELGRHLELDALFGVRNIPERTLVAAAGKIGGPRVAAWTGRALAGPGIRFERRLERWRLSHYTGFLLAGAGRVRPSGAVAADQHRSSAALSSAPADATPGG